ncbi:MAG: FtsL-like putative cell division protein [bacterium]
MGNRFREKVVEEGLESDQQSVVDSRQSVDNEPDEVYEEARGQKVKGEKVARGVAKVLGGDMLSDKLVLKQIPLLLLCLFFLLLLVANRYRVESLSREKKAAMDRINDLREQRIQLQKQYQESVKISHIAEELSETGVCITSGPPYEI